MGTVQAQTACSPGQLTAAQTPIRIFLKKREDAFPSIRGEDGAGEELLVPYPCTKLHLYVSLINRLR